MRSFLRKDDEFTDAKYPLRRWVIHPETSFARYSVEMLVAMDMLVRGHGTVDAENSYAGCILIGKIAIG